MCENAIIFLPFLKVKFAGCLVLVLWEFCNGRKNMYFHSLLAFIIPLESQMTLSLIICELLIVSGYFEDLFFFSLLSCSFTLMCPRIDPYVFFILFEHQLASAFWGLVNFSNSSMLCMNIAFCRFYYPFD